MNTASVSLYFFTFLFSVTQYCFITGAEKLEYFPYSLVKDGSIYHSLSFVSPEDKGYSGNYLKCYLHTKKRTSSDSDNFYDKNNIFDVQAPNSDIIAGKYQVDSSRVCYIEKNLFLGEHFLPKLYKLTIYETNDTNETLLDNFYVPEYDLIMCAWYLKNSIPKNFNNVIKSSEILKHYEDIIPGLPNEITLQIVGYLNLSGLQNMSCLTPFLSTVIKTKKKCSSEKLGLLAPTILGDSLKFDPCHIIDIIRQICSKKYKKDYRLLPVHVFKTPLMESFFQKDISWVMNLFLNRQQECRLSLKHNYITYNSNEKTSREEYKMLVNACFPKNVAELALKYYEDCNNEDGLIAVLV